MTSFYELKDTIASLPTVQVVDKKGPAPLHEQHSATAQLSIVIAP